MLTKPPVFLSTLDALNPVDGLLVRTSTGKQGVSLPSSRERKPDERYHEACTNGAINPTMEDTRLYHFGVESVAETL